MIPARMTAKFGATGVDNDREQESEFFLKTKVGIKIRANFQCTFFFSPHGNAKIANKIQCVFSRKVTLSDCPFWVFVICGRRLAVFREGLTQLVL